MYLLGGYKITFDDAEQIATRLNWSMTPMSNTMAERRLCYGLELNRAFAHLKITGVTWHLVQHPRKRSSELDEGDPEKDHILLLATQAANSSIWCLKDYPRFRESPRDKKVKQKLAEYGIKQPLFITVPDPGEQLVAEWNLGQ